MAQAVPLVFVSSTKLDLDDYREALIANCPRLDILYRGMEFFGARPTKPRSVVVEELTACDLYVGILARRYGSIDAVTGLSFTEFEYNTAAQMGKDRIVFVLDPRHPLPQASVDADQASIDKLSAFKAKARAELAVETFTTPESLVSAFADAVERWLRSTKSRWRRLTLAGRELDPRHKRAIANLYASNPDAIVREISVLKLDYCPAALEHFYGLLHRAEVASDVKDSVLSALAVWPDGARVIDILTEMLDSNDVHVRAQTILSIGDRARAADVEPVPLSLVEGIFKLASHPEFEVRLEVAHSLYKVPSKWPDLTPKCLALLSELAKDASVVVRERALTSIELLTESSGPVATAQ